MAIHYEPPMVLDTSASSHRKLNYNHMNKLIAQLVYNWNTACTWLNKPMSQCAITHEQHEHLDTYLIVENKKNISEKTVQWIRIVSKNHPAFDQFICSYIFNNMPFFDYQIFHAK